MTVDRLIVLVPSQGADGVELARRIWALASPCELRVVLLCAIDADANRESAARLRLATLASLIRDDRVEVTTHVLTTRSWVQAVRRHYQSGDVVICCAEQTILTVANGRQPVWRVIQWVLDLPVYVLPGMYSEARTPETHAEPMAARIWRWLAFIAIVAGFFLVEAQIDLLTYGAAQLVLFMFVAVVALGLIAIWNSFA